MFSTKGSNFTSSYKQLKLSGSELPTAVKSFYQEASPTLGDISHSIKSPQKSRQFKQIRDELNKIIDEVSEKRKTGQHGVEKVKQTNMEAIGYLNGHNSRLTYTPNKGIYNKYKKQSKTQEFRPTSCQPYFHLSPSEFNLGIQSEKNQEQTDARTENIKLKQLLNDEIKNNNELLKEMCALKSQNESLKGGKPNMYMSLIFEELAKLKQENEKLRQESIRLLESSGC